MIVFWLILVLYLTMVLLFVIGFYRVSNFNPVATKPQIAFTIIIPFRNEAVNLPYLIRSLSQVKYPKDLFEILLVNDHSEDDSLQIIETCTALSDLNITLLENDSISNSPKKRAIEMAIKKSKHPWILTTDADCILPETILESYNSFITLHHSKMVAGPVTYAVSSSFFDAFQLLDFISLQSITIGAFGINKPFLCNGANFAYSKKLFHELNGFSGNDHLSSGDDIFLLEKALKYAPKSIHYLKSKEAIVTTKSQNYLEGLVNQRVRWAKKSSAYKSFFVKITGLIVVAMNLIILVALALTILGHFSLNYFMVMLGFKILADLFCVLNTLLFFNQINHLGAFLLSSLLHPFFIVFIAIKSLFSGYQWKSREYSN